MLKLSVFCIKLVLSVLLIYSTSWAYDSATLDVSVDLIGNLDHAASVLANGAGDIPIVTPPGSIIPSTTSYQELDNIAEFSASFEVLDSLKGLKSLQVYFFHTSISQYIARVYVSSEFVDSEPYPTGYPRLVSSNTLKFSSSGKSNVLHPVSEAVINWNDGAEMQIIKINYRKLTSYSFNSSINKINVDNCTKDKNKTEPGNCGCGIADVDQNGNPVTSCLSAPNISKIAINDQKIKFRMAKYTVPVQYLVKVKSQTTSTVKEFKTKKHLLTFDLSKGSWQIRYQVAYLNNPKKIKSRHTEWQNFKLD